MSAADVVIWATLYPVLLGKYAIKGEKSDSTLDNVSLYRVCKPHFKHIFTAIQGGKSGVFLSTHNTCFG